MNIGVLRSGVRPKGAQALPKFSNFPKFLMPYPMARKPSLNSLNSLSPILRSGVRPKGAQALPKFPKFP